MINKWIYEPRISQIYMGPRMFTTGRVYKTRNITEHILIKTAEDESRSLMYCRPRNKFLSLTDGACPSFKAWGFFFLLLHKVIHDMRITRASKLFYTFVTLHTCTHSSTHTHTHTSSPALNLQTQHLSRHCAAQRAEGGGPAVWHVHILYSVFVLLK